MLSGLARRVLEHCHRIAEFSESPGQVTRTFLSEPARQCQAYFSNWMKGMEMKVVVDAAGNLRGLYAGSDPFAGRILIGSHLDTVPDAGKYDGVLGVVLAVALVEALNGDRLPCAIEVIGFSEEEGVRFGMPFIGSRALIGDLDATTLQTKDRAGVTIERAIRDFGLDPAQMPEAVADPSVRAYFEFHIEQGPVLDGLGLPLAVVETIVGQSRAAVTFQGTANHAGTTPMPLRKDALCAAAEWILEAERMARSTPGLVATAGKIEAKPGAGNVVPGEAIVTLDVRHADDLVRRDSFAAMLQAGDRIARERHLQFSSCEPLQQDAAPMNLELTNLAERAVASTGVLSRRMASGAGHDAMIVARKLPCSMIFLRSPGGVSHHPDERVYEEDVALALQAGLFLLAELSGGAVL